MSLSGLLVQSDTEQAHEYKQRNGKESNKRKFMISHSHLQAKIFDKFISLTLHF